MLFPCSGEMIHGGGYLLGVQIERISTRMDGMVVAAFREHRF